MSVAKLLRKRLNESIGIASGIDFVFQQHPELSNIGTPEQYSEYLNTIFPSSVDKNIWYHGTNVNPSEITTLRPSKHGTYGPGVYLQSKQGKYHTGTFGDNIISVIVDIDKIFDFEKYGKELLDNLREKYKDMGGLGGNAMFALQNTIRPDGYDSIMASSGNEKYLLLMNNSKKFMGPSNHHILGSQQDIEGFKKFIGV